MKKGLLFAFLVNALLAATPVRAQGTYTAASCNQSDVNGVINGPTHTAVDGDVINVPLGSCTWTSGITVPSNISISIVGAGIGNTVITDSFNGYLLQMKPTFGNTLARISGMTIQPQTSATVGHPIAIVGTCTSSCPNLRVDHVSFPSGWERANLDRAGAMVLADNVFGVLDHNVVNDSTGTGSGFVLVNVGHSAWGGVGQFGDNSWASASTLGTGQALYIENNTFNHYAAAADTDTGVTYGGSGGGRFVARFNTFNAVSVNGGVFNHGTESGGRPRGGRQMESYGNNFICLSGQGCTEATGARSGIVYSFGNFLTAQSGAWFTQILGLSMFRVFSVDFPFGAGAGMGPYDTRDGASATATSTFTGVSSPCNYGGCTLTDSSQVWATNQYAPGSNYYTAYDLTTGAIAGIVSNTGTTLTLSWCGGNGSTCFASFNSGDPYKILGTTLYAHGSYNGSNGSTSFSDTTQSWTTNQWRTYTLLNTTQGWGCEITSNTATVITCDIWPVPNWANQGITAYWNSGNGYAIVRTTVYLDSSSHSGGTNMSGSGCGSSSMVPTCVSSNAQTLDPSYQFADTWTGSVNNVVVSDTATMIANRDYYQEVSQSAQTSSSSPFNGTLGTGYGTLANRPSICTTGVGYYATDQGSWNTSSTNFPAQSFSQGELFVCTGTNTWSLHYTPYTYPHPLVTGTAVRQSSVAPPTNVVAIAH